MGSSRAGTARVAARRWLQHRAGAEVLEVRPPTRIAGRFVLRERVACQGFDGRGKTLSRSVPLPLEFSLDGALRKAAWLTPLIWPGNNTHRTVRVLTADFVEIPQQVSGENCGTCLECHSLGARCIDRLSCRLESDLSETFPPRIQMHLGRASGRAANEHKIAARLWPGSDQASMFSADLRSSGSHANTVKDTASKRSKKGQLKNIGDPRRARRRA